MDEVITITSIFEVDSPLYTFGSWVFNLFVLNILWVLFSLPIITIGASTTGMFYVTNKWVKGEKVSVVSGFVASFKANIVQVSVIWILLFVAFNVILLNLQTTHLLGNFAQIIYVLQIIALVEVVLTSIYIFPLLARHHMTILTTFRSAFLMVNRHLLTSLMLVIGLVGIVSAVYYVGVISLFIASLYALWVSYLVLPIFERYIV